MNLHGRNLLKEIDLTAAEFGYLIEKGAQLRMEKHLGQRTSRLAGRNIVLLFEKTSTRTRSAFEVAAHHEGAHVAYLGPADSQLGRKESMKDTARVLGRMFDGCYLGDGRNNTANSLLVTGAMLGMDVRICAPGPLQPAVRVRVRDIARDLAAGSGARLTVTDDRTTAVAGADYLYTDVWLSMGEPASEWGERIDLLLPYQVNAALMAATGNPAVKFMHCLPALHNRDSEIGQQLYDKFGLEALEVTDEVFESPASIVFDQAENRLHTIKAVMVATAGDGQ